MEHINHDPDTTASDTSAPIDDTATEDAGDSIRAQQEIVAAVAAYESSVLTDQQAGWWLKDMRSLVLDADPRSLDDARTMLSSTARFLSDSAAPPARSVAEMLNETEVARWAGIRLREGANPSTMSNHLQRLRRLMRVQRGLPARIAVHGHSSSSRRPATEAVLGRLIVEMRACEPTVVAAFAAAVGAGLVGADAVGARIERTDEYYVLRRPDGSMRRIIHEVADLLADLDGAEVTDGAWKQARDIAAACNVELSKEVAVSTFCRAAVGTRGAAMDVVTSFALSRKLIDRGLEHVQQVDDSELRARFRG